MNLKKLFLASVLSVAGMMAFSAAASTIDEGTARLAARNYLSQKVAATHASFKAPTMADLKLVYTEASKVEGNAFYVYNVEGGGWIIMSGDDRAKQVLAYSDKGNINMKDMPGNMKGYLNLYKNQIEEMQSYKGKVVAIKTPNRTTVVEPLVKSIWGQSNPFNRQCPQLSAQTLTPTLP